MKLEEQVVSLELARQLKEMGVKQESAFYWYAFHSENVDGFSWELEVEGYSDFHVKRISAFTVAELGEILPNENIIFGLQEGPWCQITKPPSMIHSEHADTEADARAKMMIYLIKTGKVKL